MHTGYTKLTENHIGAWSVKTDAFVIRKEHLRRAKNLIEFSDRIGGWRHEKSKNVAEPTEQWTPKKNELIPIPVFNNETRPIENEWDTESIAKDIVTHNPMMIRSKYAGGGKSHIAKHFNKLSYKTLFVVPQNSLSQNIDDDAVTTNKFLQSPLAMGGSSPSLITAQNRAFNCRGCGLRVLPEKYEAHLAAKTQQHTRESRLRTREARIKQLQKDFPNIWSTLSEETNVDENKMNQVILKVLKNDFTDIHLNFP